MNFIGISLNTSIFESEEEILITNGKITTTFIGTTKIYIKVIMDYFSTPNSLNAFLKSIGDESVHSYYKELVSQLLDKKILYNTPSFFREIKTITVVTENKLEFMFRDSLRNFMTNTHIHNFKFVDVGSNMDNKIFDKENLVILYAPNYQKQALSSLSNIKGEINCKVLFIHEYLNEYWSVYFEPPYTICPNCFVRRLRNNLPTLDYILTHNLMSNKENNNFGINIIQKVLESILYQLEQNKSPSSFGRLSLINSRTFEVKSESLIKTNGCKCQKIKLNSSKNQAVGNNSGIIKQVGPVKLLNSDPNVVYLSGYVLANKKIKGGAVDLDYENAYKRTVGECIERYNWFNCPKERIIKSSWNDLPKDKRLNLEKYQPFSPKQYQELDFPFDRLGPNQVIDWIIMNNLKSNEQVYVPSKLIIGDKELIGPNLNSRRTNGIATSIDLKLALDSAILELIERHTISKSWLYAKDIKKLIVKNINILAEYRICEEVGLIPEIYTVENDYNVTVVFCKLTPIDDSDTIISFGCSAELNLESALKKAILESIQMRVYLREQLIKKQKIHNGFLYFKGEKYHRNFLDSVDFEFVNIDVASKTNIELDIDTLPDIYYSDITLEDVQTLGYSVVQAWSPSMFSFIKEPRIIPGNLLKVNILLSNKQPLPFI